MTAVPLSDAQKLAEAQDALHKLKLGRLSISSPLAKALIGKTIGDTISVPAPGGDRSYEILGVKFL